MLMKKRLKSFERTVSRNIVERMEEKLKLEEINRVSIYKFVLSNYSEIKNNSYFI
ncbi:hypothetical protein EMIT0210MI2_10162 [Priestia megaterium]